MGSKGVEGSYCKHTGAQVCVVRVSPWSEHHGAWGRHQHHPGGPSHRPPTHQPCLCPCRRRWWRTPQAPRRPATAAAPAAGHVAWQHVQYGAGHSASFKVQLRVTEAVQYKTTHRNRLYAPSRVHTACPQAYILVSHATSIHVRDAIPPLPWCRPAALRGMQLPAAPLVPAAPPPPHTCRASGSTRWRTAYGHLWWREDGGGGEPG